MAEINPNIEDFTPEITVPQSTPAEAPIVSVNTNSDTVGSSSIHGLSMEEYNDPNQIQVVIADKNTPIVVLFGPPACGKTMTLVRLTRYLKEKGFRVEPVASFRPAQDVHYRRMCEQYNELVSSGDAAKSTSMISFMLVKILDSRGKTLCQILEAPGEYYYSPGKPNAPFPRYVSAIISAQNRKIWCYMVEPDWLNESDRLGYVDRIQRLKARMASHDKAVFVFNKIDQTPYVLGQGKVNVSQARKDVRDNYPGIFEPFRTRGIFGWNDDYEFVPFQTGDYAGTFTGGSVFEPGPDSYPRDLWNTIKKFF